MAMNVPFSHEGQIRTYQDGGHTIIEVNVSGTQGADMGIDLVGTFNLGSSDFML